MKKNYLMLGSALLLAASMTAQQLPNADFEGGWVDCVPWTSDGNTKTHGKTPNSWTISHVIGISGTGKTNVGEEIAGYDSSSAVKLINNPNDFAPDQIVPGYVTLGTTWSTAQGSKDKKDGGTFGGINFGYRPDALSFYYQRSHGTENTTEKAIVSAYLWKGTYEQKDVPGNITMLSFLSATKTTMIDRDRNILGKNPILGGSITQKGETIATLEASIEGDASKWTNKVVEFNYASATAIPEKFNVIFCAADYFSDTATPGKGNTLSVDDVKLLYYSRLASLNVAGVDIAGFDPNKFEYEVDLLPITESAYASTLYGQAKTAEVSVTIDKAKKQALIVVSNKNGADIDGQTSHTYVVTGKELDEPELSVTPAEVSLSSELGASEQPFVDVVVTASKLKADLEVLTSSDLVSVSKLSDWSNLTGGTLRLALNTNYAGGVGSHQGVVTVQSTSSYKVDINVNASLTQPELEEPEFPDGTNIYGGTLIIEMNGGVINPDDETVYNVYITKDTESTCTFTLPNFTIDLGAGPTLLGDIVVENSAYTENADKTISYIGSKNGLILAQGEIVADVIMTGTETASNDLSMKIDVMWHYNESTTIPIIVTFNGKKTGTTGVEFAPVDNVNAPIEYYNLQGVRVANPENGIFIKRQGSNVSKVIL